MDGHEVECAVIGSDPAVSTRPGEILAGAEFYTYDDKYKNGVSQVVIPAKLPGEKLDEVKTCAAMALHGWAAVWPAATSLWRGAPGRVSSMDQHLPRFHPHQYVPQADGA